MDPITNPAATDETVVSPEEVVAAPEVTEEVPAEVVVETEGETPSEETPA